MTNHSRRHTVSISDVVRSATVLVLIAAGSLAAAPDVKFLFPTSLQQGTTRTVKVHGKPGSVPLHGWCDDDGLTIEPSDSGEELTLTAAADAAPGLRWIRLYNDDGASPLLPVCVGVLPEQTEAALAQNSTDGGLTLPITISGVLAKSSEVDAYSFSLDKGQTLIASVTSRRLLGSPADPVLQLVSEQGFVLDQNDDTLGFDPQIVFTAARAGTFTIRLFAFPAEPNSTIRFAGGDAYTYRLTLTTGPYVDHLVPLSLPQNGPIEGHYVGWNLSDQPQHRLWQCEPAADVTTAFTGSFVVNRIQRRVLSIAVENPQPARNAAQRILIGSAVTGHVSQPSEVDAYPFDAAKDQPLLLTVAARSFDSPLDPVLRVLNADGKLVKEADDISRENQDVRLTLKIPADGTYRAEITDRYGHGGMRYVYELRIEEDQPRLALTLTRDRYVLAQPEPVEIPVTVDRQGGHDNEVTVSVRGLPEGVTSEPVLSQPKGDSAKQVKLKLLAETATGFSGPIEIVGSSPDFPDTIATTQTPTGGMTTTQIWLTIPPSPATDEESK